MQTLNSELINDKNPMITAFFDYLNHSMLKVLLQTRMKPIHNVYKAPFMRSRPPRVRNAVSCDTITNFYQLPLALGC